MSEWKMKDGSIRGYDALGKKRPEPIILPIWVLVPLGLGLAVLGRVLL